VRIRFPDLLVSAELLEESSALSLLPRHLRCPVMVLTARTSVPIRWWRCWMGVADGRSTQAIRLGRTERPLPKPVCGEVAWSAGTRVLRWPLEVHLLLRQVMLR